MEQHAIPQQISSYQFRLVGDMTLKQFFQVGGGALISILLYSSSLPFYVKWPLIVISFIFGVALAFFPLEDRPLSKWIFLFAKSIYAPTLYVWAKNYQKPQYFQPEGTQIAAATGQIQQPLPEPAPVESAPELEKNEEEFLTQVNKQMQGEVAVPSETVLPELPIVKDEPPEERHEVQTPQTTPIAVEQTEKPEELPVQGITPPLENYQVTPLSGQQSQGGTAPRFSPDAAPPMPPTRENIIVGQVMNHDGSIVENAILEIKDQDGRPVRALKSNKLGHFMIVTPLANGNYEIATEKEGLQFEPIIINASGEIIPPIAIRAKN